MKRRTILVAVLLLTGCASKLLPDDYAGQTAVVKDSYANYTEADGPKSETVQLFAMMEVDGKGIYNIIASTSGASATAGKIRLVASERRVPIKPMKVKLRAVVYSPSLIAENFGNDTQKTVAFAPVTDETYVVRGKLVQSGSDVWIETASGRRVTQ